jgi:amino acid adenylation domain-containing protein
MQTAASSKNRAQLIMQLKKSAASVSPLIQKRPATVPAPLSYAQERLWIMAQLEPDSSIYNMTGAIQLDGALNQAALQQSLTEVLRRHEVLRSCFTQAIQRVLANAQLNLNTLDLTTQPQLFEHCVDEFTHAAFDLSQDLPLRALLIKLDERRHRLVLVLHHIIADRWSVGLLIQEVAASYTNFSQGLPANLPELSIQYGDFAYWQRQQQETTEKHLTYWQQKLHNTPPLLELPTDRPRPPIQSYRGAMLHFELSQPLSLGLIVLAKQQNVTLFMLMAAAFSLLLSRYSHHKDLTIGYPVAGRNQTQTNNLIGFFVNTLVLRCQLQYELTFSDCLKQIRDQALQDQSHADLNFSQLVEAINPIRHAEHAPLFQVMLAVQNVPSATLQLPNLTVTPLQLDTTVSQFDLTLFVEQRENNLHAAFEYNTDLFDASTLQRMVNHLQILLENIVSSPNSTLKQLPLLNKQERQQFLSVQPTTALPTESLLIHQRFEQIAHTTPDKTALVFNQQTLSYAQLNQRANQLAHYLRAQGIKEESRIGVSAKRSAELIIALLAVLKAGAAYIPLDPHYPQQRLDYLLADADIELMLTQTALLPLFAQQRTVCIDQDFTDYSSTAPEISATLRNTAYIIYTSGSTGHPKGVLISHGNLLHSTQVRNQYYAEPLSCFLLLSSFAFDSSVAGIFWTLSQGACLCLPQQDDLNDPSALAKLIQQQQVSHLLALPSFYSTLIHDSNLSLLNSLKVAIVAGEGCSSTVANDHHHKLPRVRFYNEYGPTEGTVWTSVYQSLGMETNGILSIGHAIANMQLLIMDELGEPVPIGVSGELYIGGAGVAQSYLHQADLTAKKFVPHPFANGQRLYRSGDLVRYRADGSIEFLGRVDHQVKIRGYRIELGEIETCLLRHPFIQAAAVLAINNRLIAYVVASADLISEAEVLHHLKQTLPDYMLPALVIYLDALPLTPNGKLDRRALPNPEAYRSTQTQAFKAASNDIEALLLTAWQEVLELNIISINDNFFALGGHSLAAIQVRSRINELFHIDMPAKLLFEYPTIELIAKEILTLQVQQQDDDSLELLLQQLEHLSDDEALALLNA